MKLFKLALPILFVVNGVNAADTSTDKRFISLAACTTYYNASVGAASGLTVDAYCADKVVSVGDSCVQTKVASYMTTKNIPFYSDILNTEQLRIKSQYTYECQLASQKDAAAVQQKAASSASSSVSAATLALAGAGVTAAAALASASAASRSSNNQAGLQAAQTLAQAASSTSNQKLNSGNQGASPQAAASQAAPPPATTTAATSQQAGDGSPSATAPGNSAVAAAQPTASTAESVSTPGADASAVSPTLAASSVLGAQAALPPQAAAVVEQVPQAQNAVTALSAASKVDGTNVLAPATSITTTAEAESNQINSELAKSIETATKALNAQTPSPYSFTVTALNALKQKVQAYGKGSKSTCASMAEKATFLCVEGTSPGAVAARQVMDVAGPVLSAISSAQKTCSSTAKVVDLVNTGLTIAKGVCIVAKLTCDGTCASSASSLAAIETSISTDIGGAINSDFANADMTCETKCSAEARATGACYTACRTANVNKKTATIQMVQSLKGILVKEKVPTVAGTTPAVAAACGSLVKDIALFSVQLLGTYMAQKNAKACEQALATTGAAGAALTTQQYCEKAENVAQQLCICQKNSTATGCPGAIAAGSAATAGLDSGTNIKALSGNSAFAGFKATAANTQFSGSKGSLKNDTNGLSGLGAGADSLGSGSSGSTGGGLGASAAASGLSAPNASTETMTANKAKDGTKKWDFGAFAGGVGGLFGSGSGSGSKAETAGALSAQDLDSVKRQIASERVSAEVSNASGKSNWEKVRNMYLMKENSFILGQ